VTESIACGHLLNAVNTTTPSGLSCEVNSKQSHAMDGSQPFGMSGMAFHCRLRGSGSTYVTTMLFLA
jgi:hypothetical protein